MSDRREFDLGVVASHESWGAEPDRPGAARACALSTPTGNLCMYAGLRFGRQFAWAVF